MSKSYHHSVDVLSFARKQTGPYALVVVTSVTGGAMRAPGAMMCVTAQGDHAGYISNGCVDADIITQAQAAIREGAARFILYGEGSSLRDIHLPCGGQIALWILPQPPENAVRRLLKALAGRQSAQIGISEDGNLYGQAIDPSVGVTLGYRPKLRLRLAGRGEACHALTRLAVTSGFEVILQTPEPELAHHLGALKVEHLLSPDLPPLAQDDAYTAVITLFHDHDWEPALLASALSGPAFYIGAMGSVRAHERRIEALRKLAISEADIQKIHAPIGLVPSMRDANMLAISVLAQVVDEAQRCRAL